MTAPTFASWLLHQIERDDEVGLLARDYAYDIAGGEDLTHEYLDDDWADETAHAALIRAHAEWTLGQHYPSPDTTKDIA